MQIQLARKYNHVRKLKRKIGELQSEIVHITNPTSDIDSEELTELEKFGMVPNPLPPDTCAAALVKLVSQSGTLTYVEAALPEATTPSPQKRMRPFSHTSWPPCTRQVRPCREYTEQIFNEEIGRVPEKVTQTSLENDWRYQLRQRIETLKITDRMYESQSGEAGDGVVIAPSQREDSEQILEFNEENAGFTYEKKAKYEATMDHGYNVDADLGNALLRPIKIYETSWDVGQQLIDVFNPWVLLHKDPFFYDKTKNYELLRHKLHLRVVISGTPFHYGRAIVSYNPLATYYNDSEPARAPVNQDLIRHSQRPHIWLDPASNQGGDLDIPFFWPFNFLSITDDASSTLGDITLQSSHILRHANGGDDPISISVFAWASDVKLAVPTSHVAAPPTLRRTPLVYESQSGLLTNASRDEYGMGILSKPASAVAKAAGALSQIPFIAPYARPTEMAATAMSKIAMMFGFSRPPIISNICLFKPLPQGNLANVDAADAVQKLSLDSKQELTVDPTTVGLSPEDEMTILGFVKRESYLTSFGMKNNDGPGTNLWECRVTPALYDTYQTTYTEFHATPMAYMAQCFDHWYGSITYKFQIVKSKFHKGKILVEYDPSYFTTQEASFNTNYTRIIDLADHDDFEITVGWCQATPFKESNTFQNTTLPFSTTGGFAPEFVTTNGIIRIQILNQLVAPAADSAISFNVFTHMNDDAKFGKPTGNNLNNMSYFTPGPGARLDSQSGEANLSTVAATAPTGADPVAPVNKEGPRDDHYMEVFFGENPTSIRELLKRYSFVRCHSSGTPDNNFVTDINYSLMIRPAFRGFDPSGIDETALTTPYNYWNNNFWTHFSPCYAAYRGAFRKKFIFSGSVATVPYNPTVLRLIDASNPYVRTRNLREVQAESQKDSVANTIRGTVSVVAGAATTNLGVNNTIEVEFPYYRADRFSPARQLQSSSVDRSRYRLAMGIEPSKVPDSRDNLIASEYSACGEDMAFFFFTGVPVTYSVPTPAAF